MTRILQMQGHLPRFVPDLSRKHVTGQQLVSARVPSHGKWRARMKDFSNASFSPDLIRAMDEALEGAVATLPHPVSSMRVQTIAESILRSGKEGESNPKTLQTMALVEMQLRSDER
jgi:hypothetical protein